MTSNPSHPPHPAQRMIDQQLRNRGIVDEAVLGAMASIPRHRFIPDVPIEKAYSDQPLATAHGQTISQPYMVALMTQRLRVEPNARVLEIGTGSGYQTAILAQLGAIVVSLEQDEFLAQRARDTLGELGYSSNVTIIQTDGSLGWPPARPYDRILVTAAVPHLPQAYRQQLADPGRVVIPIGDLRQQQLTIFDLQHGRWSHQTDVGCRFVPLVGRDAWDRRDLPQDTP